MLRSRLWSERADSEVYPDQSLSYILIDVYFKKYFVSGLFLDKQRFMLEFQAGMIPRYVMYSVFALASR